MAEKDIPWLEIKTEYIDENLDKVIDYLSARHASPQQDQIYEMTCDLLEKRAHELLLSLSVSAIDEDTKKESSLHALRILGSFVLNQGDRTVMAVREAFFYFNKLLIGLVPDSYAEDLCELAVKCITQKGILFLAFTWGDMKKPNPEAIAIKVIRCATLSPEYSQVAWFQNKGSLKVENGSIELYEKNRDDSAYKKLSSSLCILDDRIRVQTEAVDRIAQSKEDDVDVMSSFTISVMREEAKTVPSPPKSPNQYQEGDKMIVKYNGQDDMGGMRVETVEGDYEKISGLIPYWSQVYLNFYNAQQVGSYLSPGCYFEAVYKGNRAFDISESFVSSLVSNTIKVGDEVNAVLKSIKNGKMTWWTEYGYPAYVSGKYNPGTYQVGDTAYLEITSCASNAYVIAKIVEPSDQPVDESDSRIYCIDGFPLEDEPKFSTAPKEAIVNQVFIRGLCRLLYRYQHCLGDASERYRVLCVCRILATMIEDSASLQYLELAADYLHNLVRFAKNETDKIEVLMSNDEFDSHPAVANWNAIIKVLQAYGKEEADEMLSEIIEKEDESPLIVKLAKLIQSSNRIDDVYPAIKNVIRNEITKLLAVETVGNADFEKASGPNLGVENSRTEFKTSFFFAPKDAEEKNQEKNVFKDLCSFLNTKEGGSLYLGVNDSGGINGLENDFDFLQRKVAGGSYKGIDGYIRYIQDRARQYFDLDVRLHFHFGSAYDDSIVFIQVDPYDHGVVEFDGVPYIRNNQESVKLGPADRRKIELRRLQTTDNNSQKAVAIAEAIREEQKVVFHAYASSSSNDIRDRNVEPFAFLGGTSFIWCYDLDDDENKLFRVSRISNIEISKEKWTKKDLHKKGETDIFHFSGEKPIPVQLQLDLMARNLLIEEYPDSETELSHMGNNLWLLNTNIYNLFGLARFYVGLANHITIIEAPELMEYVKGYLPEVQKRI